MEIKVTLLWVFLFVVMNIVVGDAATSIPLDHLSSVSFSIQVRVGPG